MKKAWIHRANSFKDAERFDAKFWKRAGVEARFSAVWKMVDEFYKIKGINGYKRRLQRSVQSIEQIQG